MASTEGKSSSWLQYHLGQAPVSYGQPKNRTQAKKSAKLTCKQIYQASHRPEFWKSHSNLEMTPTSMSRHAKLVTDSSNPAAPFFSLTSKRLGRCNGGQYPTAVAKNWNIRQSDDFYGEQDSTLDRLRSARQRLLGTTRSDHDTLLPLRKPSVSSFKEMKFFDTATIVNCSRAQSTRNSAKVNVNVKTYSHTQTRNGSCNNGHRGTQSSNNNKTNGLIPSTALDNIKVQGKASPNDNSQVMDKGKKLPQLSLSEYFCVIVESLDANPDQAYCPTVSDAHPLSETEHNGGEVELEGNSVSGEGSSSEENQEANHRADHVSPLKRRNVRFSVQNEVLEYEPWQPIEPDNNGG